MLPTCASQGLESWQPAQGTAGKMFNPGSGPAASCCQELIQSCCWLLTQPLHSLTGFPSIFSGFPSILTCFLSILSCFLSTLSHKSHRLHSDSRHRTSFPAPASFIRAQAARKRCRRGCRSWEEKMADCKAFAVQSAFVSKFQFKSRS